MLADSYRETASTSGERQDVRGSIADGGHHQGAGQPGARRGRRARAAATTCRSTSRWPTWRWRRWSPTPRAATSPTTSCDGLQSTVRVMAEPSVKLEEF
jgi:hypothetical protein